MALFFSQKLKDFSSVGVTRKTRTWLFQKSWDANVAESKKHTIRCTSSQLITGLKPGV